MALSIILGGVLLLCRALAPFSDGRDCRSCGRCRCVWVPDSKPGSRSGTGRVLLGGGGVVVFSGGCWLCGGPVAVGNGSVRGLCGSGSLSDEEEDEESEDEEDDDCAVLSGGRSPSGSSGARLAVLTGRS